MNKFEQHLKDMQSEYECECSRIEDLIKTLYPESVEQKDYNLLCDLLEKLYEKAYEYGEKIGKIDNVKESKVINKIINLIEEYRGY